MKASCCDQTPSVRAGRYNALVYVPYQLERLLLFGVLLCFDSFLVRTTRCSAIAAADIVIKPRFTFAVLTTGLSLRDYLLACSSITVLSAQRVLRTHHCRRSSRCFRRAC